MNILTLVAGTISIASFIFIGFVAGTHGWVASETAAWIQSLGAISAIAAAFAVVSYQRKINLQDTQKAERTQFIHNLQKTEIIATDAFDAVRESGRLFESISTPIDAHSARLLDSQHFLREEIRISKDTKVTFFLLQILRDVSRCIQDLEQFDRLNPVTNKNDINDKSRFVNIDIHRKEQYINRITRVEGRLDEIRDILKNSSLITV